MRKQPDHEQVKKWLNDYGLNDILKNASKLSIFSFSKGDVLCEDGEHIDHLYFLTEGKVKIFTTSPDGKRLIVRFKKPLALIGDVEFVQHTPVINTVEAVSDGFCLGISFEDLHDMQGDEPAFLRFLLQTIAQKFYTESQVTSFNRLYPLDVRLSSYLLSLSEDGQGSQYHDEMQAAHLTEVAEVLGTSYRHLNRVIKQLCEDGVIERKRGKLTILDIEALRLRAEGNIYE
ncbi:Crp/Fnr family transcriptional regulator [Jeotgalibacillus aurantiacus]|uniref:Crp/Fnr family transcriptional regulator n=1 Tax=Jeotgalibacillus aurantiacus TaxID=2763266 RepID=UPI001D0AFBBE|nr:cyclic nucleotide-binding domain-containing protein [Jeotgalibacillus aurantiacus]